MLFTKCLNTRFLIFCIYLINMVFLSLINLARSRGADRVWNRRKIFFLSAAFRGRKRNCYSVAIRSVHRALQFARLGRPIKKRDMSDLWEARIDAGCQEHGLTYRLFHEGLIKADIFLNRKVLSDLAAWEPRTFSSLTKIAKTSLDEDAKERSK